jgi:hypothetical protein
LYFLAGTQAAKSPKNALKYKTGNFMSIALNSIDVNLKIESQIQPYH